MRYRRTTTTSVALPRYHVYITLSKHSDKILLDNLSGLFGIVDFYEFNLSLIPIESDLFSLEMPIVSMRNLGDDSWAIARALWQLQSLYGCIPTTFCIGPLAKQTEKHFRLVFKFV